MRRVPGGVGAINRQRLARVTSVQPRKNNQKKNLALFDVLLAKQVSTLNFFNLKSSLIFFSGEVCYKGHRNSRHSTVPSNNHFMFLRILVLFLHQLLAKRIQFIQLGGVCRFKSVEYQFHMNCFASVMKSLSKYLRQLSLLRKIWPCLFTFRWGNSQIPSRHHSKTSRGSTNRRLRRTLSLEATFSRCVLASVSTLWHVSYMYGRSGPVV